MAHDMDTPAVFNPFPGLRPFATEEAHLFFGREGQSVELLRSLRQHRFVAVVGPSGSGKSSLVHAGLLPSLFGGFMRTAGSRWRVAVLRPGADPIGNLTRTLSDPDALGNAQLDERDRNEFMDITLRRGSLGLAEAVSEARLAAGENLLVVVDQFEEIFRFERVSADTEFRDDAAAFVKLLLEASQAEAPIYVLLTMRSDYLGDCAQFRDLPEAINRGQYLIPRMTRDERRVAVTGPAAVGGGEIAPRLVNRILNDVGAEPDQLPILQHALMRAWTYWQADRAADEPLDLRHYEAIGGAHEALARHAEEAYTELDPAGQQLAEKVFRRLTERGTDNRDIRRPTRFAELCAIVNAEPADVAAVIEVFRRPGRSFLTPPPKQELRPETLVDISHESFIRGWPRLQAWVAAEAEAAKRYSRLADTAALWETGQAGPLQDPELGHMLEWWRRDAPGPHWGQAYHPGFAAAQAFLKYSHDEQETQRRREQARETARQRWRQVAIGALAAGLIVAVGFARSARTAERAARSAQQAAQGSAQAALDSARVAQRERDRAEQSAQAALLAQRSADGAAADAALRAQEALAARNEAYQTRSEADSLNRIYSDYTMKAVDVLGDSAYRQPGVVDLYDALLAVADSSNVQVRQVNARSFEPRLLQARLRVLRAYANRLRARNTARRIVAADSTALEVAAVDAAREALDLADGLSAGQTDREALRILLWIYYSAGELLRQHDDTASAGRGSRTGIALAEASRDTSDSILYWYARLHMLDSDIAFARGDSAGAIRKAARGVNLSRQLVTRVRTPATLRPLSSHLDAYGSLLQRTRRYGDALTAYREELAIDSTLLQSDSSASTRRDVRWSWGRVGYMYMELDSFPASENALLRQVAFARSIGPADAEALDRTELDRARRGLLTLYLRWARQAIADGDSALALRRYRQRVSVARERVADGESEATLDQLVTALEEIIATLPADSITGSLRARREVLATRERIAELDNSAAARRGVAAAAEALGFRLGELDSIAPAVQAFQRAAGIRRADWRENYRDGFHSSRADFASTLGNLSWFLLFAGRPAESLAAAEEGLRTAPAESWIHTNQAHALMQLGRTADAAVVYQAYRGATINDGTRPWEEVIREDVAALVEKRALTPAQARTIQGWLESAAPAVAPGWDASPIAGQWTGTYTCGQGATGLTLTLAPAGPLGQVEGRFAFQPLADNPSVPSGEYRLIGWYTRAGEVELVGTRWVREPEGYVMVGLSGRLTNAGQRLEGTVPECDAPFGVERR